jgi:hypothetical protein
MRSDFVKVGLLALVYIGCLWTAVKTFLLQPNAPQMMRTIALEPNYSLCTKYEHGEQYEDCKQAVVVANKLVLKECSGYFDKLNICLKSTSNPCTTQKSNAERCAQVVQSQYVSGQGY